MTPTRRGLLTGIGALLCAPAIVRASSIMPVKPIVFSSAGTFVWPDDYWVETVITDVQDVRELWKDGPTTVPYAVHKGEGKVFITRGGHEQFRVGDILMMPRKDANQRGLDAVQFRAGNFPA